MKFLLIAFSVIINTLPGNIRPKIIQAGNRKAVTDTLPPHQVIPGNFTRDSIKNKTGNPLYKNNEAGIDNNLPDKTINYQRIVTTDSTTKKQIKPLKKPVK